MLSERYARSAFDRAGSHAAREQLARELGRLLAAQLPAPDAAAWLRGLVEDLERLGHTLRLESDTDQEMQVWGDCARIWRDVVGHDLALFVYGRFEAGTPIRIDGLEVLWQKT